MLWLELDWMDEAKRDEELSNFNQSSLEEQIMGKNMAKMKQRALPF